MRIEDCFFLGNISRTHGKNGGLVLKLETDQPDKYYKMESVLIALQEELVPFFILESSPLKHDLLLVQFDEVNWEDAQRLVGLELYLPLSKLPRLEGKNFYFHEVEGFTAIDRNIGNLGQISYVLERPSQPLFVIAREEKEIFVPAIDEFIEKIDRQAKTVYLNCPEGLLDVFTS